MTVNLTPYQNDLVAKIIAQSRLILVGYSGDKLILSVGTHIPKEWTHLIVTLKDTTGRSYGTQAAIDMKPLLRERLIHWCAEQYGEAYSETNPEGIWQETEISITQVGFRFKQSKYAMHFSMVWDQRDLLDFSNQSAII